VRRWHVLRRFRAGLGDGRGNFESGLREVSLDTGIHTKPLEANEAKSRRAEFSSAPKTGHAFVIVVTDL
jgi:hypothetical protein